VDYAGSDGAGLNGNGVVRSRHAHGRDPLSAATVIGHGLDDASAGSCWLCGLRQPMSQLVADGTSACEDIRWYCRDAQACTERWTTRAAPAPGIAQGSVASVPYDDQSVGSSGE
jgi:hypothetical protein